METAELRTGIGSVAQVAKELQRDFEEFSLTIVSDVASSDDPTQWLDVITELLQRDGGENGISLELKMRMDVDLLPQLVQILLSKSFDLGAVERVNNFFQWVLATIAKRLQQADTSRLPCLNRILDVHRRFYLYHGTGSDNNGLGQGEETQHGEDEENQQPKCQRGCQALRFARSDDSEYTSKYFLRNLEFWGQLGGFSLFVEVPRGMISPASTSIKSVEGIVSFDAVQSILRTLYALKDYLYPDFLLEYFPELVDAICKFIKNQHPDEFFALSRDSLMEVVQIAELLLAKIQHDFDVNGVFPKVSLVPRGGDHEVKNSSDDHFYSAIQSREVCEQRLQLLRLELSLRFFKGNSLEKRIYGLTEIVVVISRLYNDQIQAQPEPTAASLYATLNFLVEWMHEKQLMQELLGEKMHVELIKRSTSLFQFVSELECLPTEWIDLVWNCYHADNGLCSSGECESQVLDAQLPRPAQQRHEAFRTTMQDLLLEMVEFVELPSLSHLLSRIEMVDANLDPNHLGLLAAIAARRLLAEELPQGGIDISLSSRKCTLRQRILMHLWTVVLPSVNAEDFRDEIMLRMHEILRLEVDIAEGRENEEEQNGSSPCASRGCSIVNEFLSLCLDNISQRKHLTMSLKLLTQLASLVSEVGIVVLAAHQSNLSFVQIVLSEINGYKRGIRQELLVSEWSQMRDEERAALPVLKEYVNNIKIRLLALRASWILDERSNIDESSFAMAQMDAVWELMVTDAFLLDEAALCFQWIELCLNTPTPGGRLDNETPHSARALMPLSIAKYLLMTKFRALSGECITLSTLCCFHSIFRRVNLVEGGLEIFTASANATSGANVSVPTSPTRKTASANSVDSDKEESVELVTGLLLVGLDELWKLAITASDSAVAEEIITLLASYHLAFSPSIRCTNFPFQSKMFFLEKCMEFMTTAKANAVRNRFCSSGKNASRSSILEADIVVVNRCVDLLRYFLEACSVGDDLTENGDAEALMKKLEIEETSSTPETNDEKAGEGRNKVFRLEHLEERLPYLDIYPSPMKDMQSDVTINAMLGFRAARRPSWTFRQQHALLDVIEDTNEEADVEETNMAGQCDIPPRKREQDDTTTNHFEREILPLKIDPVANLLGPGSPIKPGRRSPCMKANLRWPQAPSPQRGPDLRSEDIDREISAFTLADSSTTSDLYQDGQEHQGRPLIDDPCVKSPGNKTKYGVMSQILANRGSYFDSLLELVDWGETTSQRTWDLLCRLPTNNKLLREMIHLRPLENDGENEKMLSYKDVDWSTLLDRSNIHRLLYSLRLVEALLIPIEKGGNSDRKLDSARRQWRERFVRLGGANHLYETLLKWPNEHSLNATGSETSISSQYAKNLRATCLAAVMRVLNYFFHWMQLTTAETIQNNKLSQFDLRLRCSTLPEFVKSIELVSVLQVTVKVPQQFCSQKCQQSASFSDEEAEVVYCSVLTTSSLMRYSPDLTTTLAGENESPSSGKSECGVTLQGWLKALLVDCPSKSTRVQLLDVLSEMAMTFSNDYRNAAQKFFERLVISSCDLVAESPSGDSSRKTCFDELFTLCSGLLECSKGVQVVNNGSSGNDEVNEIIAKALIKKRVPERLVLKLSRIASQEQASVSSSIIRPPRSQYEAAMCGYLQLLSMLPGISEHLRATLLQSGPETFPRHNHGPSTDKQQLMICFVLKHLLFGDASNKTDALSPPVCKTSVARDLAQRLLLSLAFRCSLKKTQNLATGCELGSTNADILTVVRYLRDYQAQVLDTVNIAGRQWNCTPSDELLDTTKNIRHAGLVNPGCICYMNALIQQLFMMPSFCRGLLALDSSQSTVMQQSSSWKEEVEQLQKLFVKLAYTNRRSSDPTAFALSHKDMDGESTDVHIQMDADEFFSLLLDRVEMFIRPQSAQKTAENTKYVEDAEASGDDKDFMDRCFGGVLVNQIITNQGNLSEREEKFFALSLEVSKKRNLTESLALYVQGESLEGENAYFCERVQRKVSATKRVCIKRPPQTLVCHLKRFEFDYSTMEKMKINDYLEFPSELDMYPFTSEALAATDVTRNDVHDQSIMYDLVGVVVHSGTADTGHYYSFIKDRRETEDQRWLEFNDEVVREFDVETMGEECFGGEEVAQKWDPIQGAYTPIVQMKRRSAYMLIYEMRYVQDCSSLMPEATTTSKHELSSQVQALAAEIMQENMRYESVVNAFDPTYAQLIRDLVENVTHLTVKDYPAVVREAYQLGCHFLFGINSLRCHIPSTMVSPSGSLTYASAPAEMSTYTPVSTQVAQWLSGYVKDTDNIDGERVIFSKWIFAEVVASPIAFSSSPSLSQVESQRTWLFDILFLGPADTELVDCCFRVLLAAVDILKHQAAAGDAEAEQSLLGFYRELLNIFYNREVRLDIRDPVSGSILTLSLDARIVVMKQLGAFLDACIGRALSDIPSQDKEMCVLRQLFLEKLHYLSRFLQCLQTPCEDLITLKSTASTTQPSPARNMTPLVIETKAASCTQAELLRLCTFRIEMDITKHLLESQHPTVPPPVDTTLLLNHTALKNVLVLGLEELFMPVLTCIAFEIESKRDRLVALLIGLLEEVRSSHADQLLDVIGALLDAEEACIKSLEVSGDLSGSALPIHHHVFSPSRGILESAAYYRDRHALRDYIFLLLEFVVHRASKSPVLQELFRSDPEFHDHIYWIPNWLTDYLDANGEIRKQMKALDVIDCNEDDMSEKAKSAKAVQNLFTDMEKALGVVIPCYCEDSAHEVDDGTLHGQELLSSTPITSSAVAAEDVVLQHIDLDKENQNEAQKDHRAVEHAEEETRLMRKINLNDDGPEHEGTEVEAQANPKHNWKLYQSSEELAMLRRMDFEATHNNAREA